MGKRRTTIVCLVGACALMLGTWLAPALADTYLQRISVATQFISGQEIPESVTSDDAGNIYVSVGNSIRRRTPNGTLSVFGTLPLPINALGVKVGPDGCVYNASTSLSAVPGAFVWRLCGSGSVEVYAELDHLGAPNDLAFDQHGNLFVTDPVLARIWKIDPARHVEVFVQHARLAGDPANPALIFRPIGVNGIAFDPSRRFVYVSNTDKGSILRIGLRSRTHTPAVFAADARLRGADGIAFDQRGTLFVAVNARDALVTINRRGKLHEFARGGLLDAPSSFVFGVTRHDRRTLYLTSSAFSRTLGLQTGTPQPALLTLQVATPGLTLP